MNPITTELNKINHILDNFDNNLSTKYTFSSRNLNAPSEKEKYKIELPRQTAFAILTREKSRLEKRIEKLKTKLKEL